MTDYLRPLLLIVLGAAGLGSGVYTLMKMLKTGTATLRGGRRISVKRRPVTYWTSVGAMGTFFLMQLVLVYIGLKAWP